MEMTYVWAYMICINFPNAVISPSMFSTISGSVLVAL